MFFGRLDCKGTNRFSVHFGNDHRANERRRLECDQGAQGANSILLFKFRPRGHRSILCDFEMNHVSSAADGTVFHKLLMGTLGEIYRYYDFFATRITNVDSVIHMVVLYQSNRRSNCAAVAQWNRFTGNRRTNIAFHRRCTNGSSGLRSQFCEVVPGSFFRK